MKEEKENGQRNSGDWGNNKLRGIRPLLQSAVPGLAK